MIGYNVSSNGNAGGSNEDENHQIPVYPSVSVLRQLRQQTKSDARCASLFCFKYALNFPGADSFVKVCKKEKNSPLPIVLLGSKIVTVY